MEALQAFDVKDERRLVGFAENVFVGRVLEKVGNKGAPPYIPPEVEATMGPNVPRPDVPRTQFSVEVQENTKGDLGGTVVVDQAGGAEGPGLLLMEGDPMLEPGETVLFATRYDEDEDRHVITTQPFGDVRIRGAEDRKEEIDKFKKAQKEQIVEDYRKP